jgi:hypothetical protein
LTKSALSHYESIVAFQVTDGGDGGTMSQGASIDKSSSFEIPPLLVPVPVPGSKGKGKRKDVNSETTTSGPSTLLNRGSLDHVDKPDSTLREHLLDLFFQHIGYYFPYIDQDKTDRLSPLLVNSICCHAARFSTDERVTKGRSRMEKCSFGIEYGEKAKSILVNTIDAGPSRDILVALLLLTWYDYSLGNDAGAWCLIEMATKIAFQLQLHMEKPAEEKVLGDYGGSDNDSKGESQELDSKDSLIFWSLYSLSNIYSFRNGKPTLIKEERIQRPLPSRENFNRFVRMMTHVGNYANLLTEMQKGVDQTKIKAIVDISTKVKADFLTFPPMKEIAPGHVVYSKLYLWTFALLCAIDALEGFHEPLHTWNEYGKLAEHINLLRREESMYDVNPIVSHTWLKIAQHDLSMLLEPSNPSPPSIGLELQHRLQSFYKVLDELRAYWALARGSDTQLRRKFQELKTAQGWESG